VAVTVIVVVPVACVSGAALMLRIDGPPITMLLSVSSAWFDEVAVMLMPDTSVRSSLTVRGTGLMTLPALID
jgi:hypothetical protein